MKQEIKLSNIYIIFLVQTNIYNLNDQYKTGKKNLKDQNKIYN